MQRWRYANRTSIGLSVLLFAMVALPETHAARHAATHTVIIQGITYRPVTVTAHVGDTVIWKNEDLVPHTVTAQGRQFDSGDLQPGKTWRYTATKKGRYAYGCDYHPDMHGVLIVR